MRFLDTDVLLYSIGTAADEAGKRAAAAELLDRDDCALSVQVLEEFYVQATRPTRCDPIPHRTAVGLIRTWLRFEVQDNTMAVLHGALEIKAVHGFSYRASAVVAAARALGCRELYTEDLSHGREIEGVRIVNPFR